MMPNLLSHTCQGKISFLFKAGFFIYIYPPFRIIFSTPLAIIAYFLIWFVPDFSQGQVLWYLLFYCLFETLVTVSVGTSPRCQGRGGGSPWGLQGWCLKPHLSVHCLTGQGPLFHNSVSTFPTQLSLCSSAQNRVSGIRPLPTVSLPRPLIPPTWNPGSPAPWPSCHISSLAGSGYETILKISQSPPGSGEIREMQGLARSHTEQGHEFRPRCHLPHHLIATLPWTCYHHLELELGFYSSDLPS